MMSPKEFKATRRSQKRIIISRITVRKKEYF